MTSLIIIQVFLSIASKYVRSAVPLYENNHGKKFKVNTHVKKLPAKQAVIFGRKTERL